MAMTTEELLTNVDSATLNKTFAAVHVAPLNIYLAKQCLIQINQVKALFVISG